MITTYILEDVDQRTDRITVKLLDGSPTLNLRQLGGTEEDVRYDLIELTEDQLNQLIKLKDVLFPNKALAGS